MSEMVPPGQPMPVEPVSANKDERIWVMACHLAALAGYLIPFGNVIGPLVVWLVKKDESARVDEHGRESLNFQISMTIYCLVSIVLVFIIIGAFLLLGLAIFNLIVIILATVRAADGQSFRYPLTIRFIGPSVQSLAPPSPPGTA